MLTDLRLQFAEFSLDRRNACVWRGSETLKLKPKAFDVLRYLVEHAGQLVSKDDLWRAVWPDVAVTDGVLAVCLTEIRQALGDDAKAPRFIETVHRRGYRFIAPLSTPQSVQGSTFKVPGQEEKSEDGLAFSVQSLESENLTPSPADVQTLGPRPQTLDDFLPAQRSWSVRSLVLMGLVLLFSVIIAVHYLSLPLSSTQPLTPNPQSLPLPDKPSLIMLPLVNLSGDSSQEYFSDGLTEVLTSALSRISGLFVIARNSAFFYKSKQVTVQEISREMGVRYVVEGSVQKADQRVRITVRLIEATTGYLMWSEQYDRSLTDIFSLQDEIVQKIVTTLKLQLTLEEQGYILRKHTTNMEAYDYFLRGVAYWYRFTKDAILQARQQFEHAIALDPQYAEAYEWLDVTYYNEWVFGWSMNPHTLERAFALAQKAVALDDSLPTAHWGLSELYALTQQYDQAIAEGQRAIALDPNNADSYVVLAQALFFAGRPEESLTMLAQARRLNPHTPAWYLINLGQAYRLTGRYADAIAALQDALTQSPDHVHAHLNLALSYLLQWMAQQEPDSHTLEPARGEVQRALDLSASLPWNHTVLGAIELCQQQYEQALAEMERAVALVPTDAGSVSALAVVLSAGGRTAEALAAAAQASSLKSIILDEQFLNVGAAYATVGQYEEARTALQRFLSHYPNILLAHLQLATVYSELGQDAAAQKEAAEVLRLNPNFSLAVHKQRAPIKDPALLERHIAALRKAGLK